MPDVHKEFIFVDESGDPGHGEDTDPLYILLGVHMDEGAVNAVRQHLSALGITTTYCRS